MRALLLKKYTELELVEMPMPEIGPEDVLVRVRACGICGSDVHGFDGSTGRRIPPLVMGHEAAGVIAETGARVENLREGERVTFDSTIFCGSCFFCRRGEINLCDNRQVLGVSCADYRRHGAFAEYVAVPQRVVYKLPESLSFETGTMIEAVSVAVHAVSLTPVRLGDTAVVVGSGMIGLLAIQALRLAGCACVIAVDVDESKLKTAGLLGADHCVNPNSVDVPSLARECTGGRGADIAMEVVGATEPLHTALGSPAQRGELDAGGQPLSEGRTAAAIGGHAPDQADGLLRLFRRVPCVHQPTGSRRDPGGADYQRRRAARRGTQLVPAVVQQGTGPDEGHPETLGGIMSHALFDLTGKVAIVTGTSRGLGQYFGRALARAGADLVITSRKLGSLESFQKEIEKSGEESPPARAGCA